MDFQLESNPSTPYVSAPTSPSRVSFYSAPGSPTKGVTASPYAWESKHGLIKGTTTDTDSDDFDFTTSQKFRKPMYQQHRHRRHPQQQQQHQKVEQLSDMSYADELFSNGEVVPLKPPPRLQYTINRSSSVSSSRSPSSILFRPFPGQRFKTKEDFDPFMVALENVKKDETRRIQWIPCQRSQSFSLLRSTLRDDPTGRVQVQHQNNKVGHPEPPIGRLISLPKGSIKVMRSASERFMGDMRLDPDSPYNSTLTTPAETAKDTGGPSTKVTRRWRSFPKGSKRRIVRDFLLRSVSKGRADPKDKLRNNTAALKVTVDKDPSFYPLQETHDNENKSTQAAEDMMKAIVPHKQSLFDCLGISFKAQKNMS